jgi:hypothetical protein
LYPGESSGNIEVSFDRLSRILSFKQDAPFGMIHLRLYSVSFLALSAVAAGFAWLSLGKRKKRDREQDRRLRLSKMGRLTDGTATDVQEGRDEQDQPVQLLIYHYDVAGVSYEASQDITKLSEIIDVHSCQIGMPASVKYDPQNPGNSIVISEIWSGLRK